MLHRPQVYHLLIAVAIAFFFLLAFHSLAIPSPGLSAASLARPLATDLSGEIVTDTIWTLASSPYVLTNTVVVPAGVTLTVEPGVEVLGQAGTMLRVQGHLAAVGTAAQPITFTSVTDSGPNEWAGLVFDGGTGDLRHVTVRYGGTPNGYLGPSGSNILVQNVLTGEVRLESSGVVGADGSWTYADYGLYVANSRLVVSDTLFAGNGTTPWDVAFYAAGGSVVTVTQSAFEDNTGAGLWAVGPGTALTVTESTFQDNGGYGLYTDGNVASWVADSVFSGNGSYPLSVGVSNLPWTLDSNSFSGNHPNRLQTWGTLPADLAFSDAEGLTGYELVGQLVVPGGITLTVQPGIEVLGQAGTMLRVQGHLAAVGTAAQPITFTSVTDSGPNEWAGLVFDGGTGDLRHVTVRYGGTPNGYLGPSGSNILVQNVLTGEVRLESSGVVGADGSWTYADYGLYVANSRLVVSDTLFAGNGTTPWDVAFYAAGGSVVTVTQSAFEDNTGAGLWAVGPGTALTVTHSVFQSNGGYGLYTDGNVTVWITGSIFTGNASYPMRIWAANLPAALSGSTFSGNHPDRLQTWGTLPADTTFSDAEGLTGYELVSHLVVPAGITLTVEPGMEILGYGGTTLRAQGHLAAMGTATRPITFTSVANSGPNEWAGLIFDGGTGDLRHVTVRYAGSPNGMLGDFNGSNITAVDVTAGVVRLENCQVTDAGGHYYYPDYGLYASNSQLIISDTLFARNGIATDDRALSVVSGSNVTVTGSTLEGNVGMAAYASGATLSIEDSAVQGNPHGGILVQGANLNVSNSTIAGNSFGIDSFGPGPVIQATYNWWGYASGPYNASTNPDGQGDSVHDNVVYDPWLAKPPGSRQVIPLALGQVVTDTVASLDYRDYQLVITAGLSILVQVTPLDDAETLWTYSRFGDLPLWTRYDLRTQGKTPFGTYELMLSPTQSGSYYLSVYGRNAPATGAIYRIVAYTVEQHLSDVTPHSAGNAGEITLQLLGLPFADGMGVELRRTGSPTLTADSVILASPTALWAHFDLSGTVAGVYDVVALWPGGAEAGLTEAFTITQGIGPRLEAHLVVPPQVRPGREYVLWIEYENEGDADMDAPVFRLSNSAGASMQIGTDGQASNAGLAILGVSMEGPPGTLSPGRRQRIPASFVAPSFGPIQFDLTTNLGDDTPVDWSTLETFLRPDYVDDATWSAFWADSTAQFGSTWGELLHTQATLLNTPNAVPGKLADFADTLLYVLWLTNGSPGGHDLGFDPATDVHLSWKQLVPNACCTYVVTHGMNASANDVDGLATRIAAHCPNCNVVEVDWKRGADTGLDARLAGSRTQAVAQEAYRQLRPLLADCEWDNVTYVPVFRSLSIRVSWAGGPVP